METKKLSTLLAWPLFLVLMLIAQFILRISIVFVAKTIVEFFLPFRSMWEFIGKASFLGGGTIMAISTVLFIVTHFAIITIIVKICPHKRVGAWIFLIVTLIPISFVVLAFIVGSVETLTLKIWLNGIIPTIFIASTNIVILMDKGNLAD